MRATQIKLTGNVLRTIFTPLAIVAAASLASPGLLVSPAQAQSDYSDSYRDSGNYVTIYEDCGFRGRSKTLEPGEYRRMRGVGFENDSVSSVRVPRGLELVIYEDNKFRGPYARIDRDIQCFDRQWDNRVSSMKVSGQADEQPHNSRDDRYRDRRDDDRRYRDSGQGGYDGRDYDNRGRDNQGRDNRDRAGARNVSAKNLAQVVFNQTVLQQTGTKQWRMNSPRGGVSQYKETRRDQDSVYLRNDYTAERVRIDLFANDVTLVSRDGRQQRYNIDRKLASVASVPRVSIPSDPTGGNYSKNYIQGSCFTYKAYTLGGQGGVRFYGKDGFFQFARKAHTGRVCHSGELTMEINKTNPNTEVIVEIQSKKFRFANNEKPDAFKNTWYRKRHQLNIGG